MKNKLYLLGVVLGSVYQGFAEDTVSLSMDAGIAEIRVPSVKNWQYAVESSEDLKNWVSVKKEIFGTGSDIICTNSLEEASCRFYRTKRSSEFTMSFENTTFQVGSQWLYDVSENVAGDISNYQELERVDRISLKNGYTVAELALYNNSTHWVETDYVLHETNGIFAVGYKNSGKGEVFFEEMEESPLNRFTPGVTSDPQTWPPPESGYSTLTVRTTSYIEYSTVIVPAGSFSVTMRREEVGTGTYTEPGFDSIPFTMVVNTWYAKDVGEVKSVMTLTFSGYGQLGTETRMLRSYSIP